MTRLVESQQALVLTKDRETRGATTKIIAKIAVPPVGASVNIQYKFDSTIECNMHPRPPTAVAPLFSLCYLTKRGYKEVLPGHVSSLSPGHVGLEAAALAACAAGSNTIFAGGKQIDAVMVNSQQRMLNCIPSREIHLDAIFVPNQPMTGPRQLPAEVDLRSNPHYPSVDDQMGTGACVGFAAAATVQFAFKKAGKNLGDKIGPRFIWMACKEADQFVERPTTMVELAGTSIKTAVQVLERWGCVTEKHLPMTGGLSTLKEDSFYELAAELCIKGYRYLHVAQWTSWLTEQGTPIITAFNVDSSFDNVNVDPTEPLSIYGGNFRGGHAVAIVGFEYRNGTIVFIIRNSWGSDWGDKGHAYVTLGWAMEAFGESWGLIA